MVLVCFSVAVVVAWTGGGVTGAVLVVVTVVEVDDDELFIASSAWAAVRARNVARTMRSGVCFFMRISLVGWVCYRFIGLMMFAVGMPQDVCPLCRLPAANYRRCRNRLHRQ